MPLLPVRDHKKRAQDSESPEAPLPRRPPPAADNLRETLADRTDAVHGRDLARSFGDAIAELERSEHLRARAELEQFTKRLLEILEADREDAAASMQVARKMAKSKFACAQLDLDARARRLEGSRPLLPVRTELEIVRPLEAFVAGPHGDEARGAIDAHARRAVRDEVPGAALEDEPERIERAPDNSRALSVPGGEPALAPRRSGDGRQMRHRVLAAEPAARVEMEVALGPAGALLQLGRKSGEHLQARVGQHAAQAQLRRRSRRDEEG